MVKLPLKAEAALPVWRGDAPGITMVLLSFEVGAEKVKCEKTGKFEGEGEKILRGRDVENSGFFLAGSDDHCVGACGRTRV